MALRSSLARPLCIAAAAAVSTAGIGLLLLSSSVLSFVLPRLPTSCPASLRKKLPQTLAEWRRWRGDEENPENALWLSLKNFFEDRGYTLWSHHCLMYFRPPQDIQGTCNGFAFAPLHRGWDGRGSRLRKLNSFDSATPLNHPARAVDGRDVVIRVIRIASAGEEHLRVLHFISRGLGSQVTPNHAVPLLELIELDDITFGVFPRVGCCVQDAYKSWVENSVGDVVDMIMQCLEALAYLHSSGVAHRDAFKDNFLVQWHPESLAPDQLTISRPRVFLHDFETAVFYAQDVPPEKRTCIGLPLSPSFPSPDQYFRDIAPEISKGPDKPYDPFKLDVWQFGTSLSDLETTLPEIDTVLRAMTEEDPLTRVSAYNALVQMSRVVDAMPPEALRIPPVVQSS